MLEVDSLICGYHAGKPVVGPVSFHVKKGEVACLVGPNGIGKTTLLKTVLGLLKPMGGTITINGKPGSSYTVKDFARTVAYVPQGHVPPFPYAVKDVVVMGCNPNMNEFSSPRSQDYDTAMEMLDRMGISHLADRDYTELSGGERQMVVIARALAQKTEFLVMDEPTTHLDYGNGIKVLTQVSRLADVGYTILMITHAPDHAFWCADRIIAVGKNGFFQEGSPEEVLTEEILKELYSVDIRLTDVLLKDVERHVKVCVPMAINNIFQRKENL
ncbi:MAG: ABC transporter ATP-binding protein [Lachnospiraceae bacterium]|nr:ABC transporter ATP-binding protein [Lachnospiraceae bacterium]MDY4971389.1 ABC transporter ATP-binding protein [Lachnospiraceae bacterium]